MSDLEILRAGLICVTCGLCSLHIADVKSEEEGAKLLDAHLTTWEHSAAYEGYLRSQLAKAQHDLDEYLKSKEK